VSDLGWKTGVIGAACIALAVGCGGGKKDADSADSADATGSKDGSSASGKPVFKGSLDAGTEVCITASSGVRYVIEDLLEERGLTVAGDCMLVDVELEEVGEAGAWELKYRAPGGEWQSCKSAVEERTAFLRECLGSLGAEVQAGGEDVE